MYAIYHCTRTLELYRREKDTSHARIPMETVKTVTGGQVVTRKAPALPGLIFVPVSHRAQFERGVPSWYRTKPMLNADGVPASVTPEDLVQLQHRLNEEGARFTTKEEQEGELWLVPSDEVEVVNHPFLNDVKGYVQKVKSDGTVRMATQLNMPFIEIHKKFLVRCNL